MKVKRETKGIEGMEGMQRDKRGEQELADAMV